MIRNVADQGIEDPGTRVSQGKSSSRTLTIKAAHENNQVVIYVKDDGAGIDHERMRLSAVKKGMLSEGEAAPLRTERQWN
ncbi:ATP-binding protein [Paenibacillus dakarensis]|uniref:ATP-binding protein n=1 Tax=Paenibacillus dakarensis TaxID=1527293 RepID=UPI0006D5B5D7|nr:ATP-binding protein [Paenibacillus dakarensis]